MKFVSFKQENKKSWGILEGDTIVDLGAIRLVGGASLGESMRRNLVPLALDLRDTAPTVNRASVELLPPVTDAGKIICVGLNYADHIAEMNRPTPEFPVIFTRFNDSLVGDGEALVAPTNSMKFDFEGEMAVVIGSTVRHATREEAQAAVFGYSVFNDGSIRDYQRHTHQFAPGKNFPKSGSFGPAIVTPDEIDDLGSKRITTKVNDVVVQDSTLDQLIFSVEDLIIYCSEWTTLNPGDVIVTGTPGGVGDGRDPQLWLFPGDVVEVEVEGIGRLVNPVIEERS
ncbi:2-keto-4-pentenoate hydratase/2-oxohepta-3-ene-1,7-dioic acid hydratase in catechol pathway [Aurantimicrobium minutum]|uniref:fumarylacetoacetate hydrolase family protein n=1 Tax=Aurantimicrobium minutum TaxID=708131 RepID=UPI0024751E5F|nr:fumarylacetoacetate hydrolase family protein [Aurantimicrobium minutum]MDH6277821.1 2-keto-4-pentenoate hydratase/2-oxohepta-3-ene-1,7-dioic acid hydratase in catechol pathway [Aurantimicrobium minutum]